MLNQTKNRDMNTLQLKHLSAYLPYKVKCLFKTITDADHYILGKQFERELLIVDLYYLFKDYPVYEYIKPLLYPLDLTKEIEHNGERFVPLERLDFKSENEVQFSTYDNIPNQLTITATYKQMGETFTEFVICRNSFDLVNYWIVQQLIEWKLDIFNLIPQKLAIDINSLKKETK